jgi:hypothetical protein
VIFPEHLVGNEGHNVEWGQRGFHTKIFRLDQVLSRWLAPNTSLPENIVHFQCVSQVFTTQVDNNHFESMMPNGRGEAISACKLWTVEQLDANEIGK